MHMCMGVAREVRDMRLCTLVSTMIGMYRGIVCGFVHSQYFQYLNFFRQTVFRIWTYVRFSVWNPCTFLYVWPLISQTCLIESNECHWHPFNTITITRQGGKKAVEQLPTCMPPIYVWSYFYSFLLKAEGCLTGAFFPPNLFYQSDRYTTHHHNIH